MKIKKEYTVTMTEKDYNDLLAVLAYISGKVEYGPEAAQHSNLKSTAKDLWVCLQTED